MELKNIKKSIKSDKKVHKYRKNKKNKNKNKNKNLST